MRKNFSKFHYWSFAFIVFFGFLLITPLHNFSTWIPPSLHQGFYSITQIDPSQDTGYYVYLRSTFFDHDIDFANEIYWHKDEILPTGYVFNHWSPGIAILWLPFFLIGHGVALLYHSLGYPISLDGYSFIYHAFIGLGVIVYAYLFLLLCYEILKKYFSPTISFMTSLTMFFSSSMMYYTYIRSRMSHTGELFLVALVVYIWLFIIDKKLLYIKFILLGIAIGLLTMTRHNDAIILAIPIFEIFFLAYGEYKEKKVNYVKFLSFFLCLILSFLIAILPNLITLEIINGAFLPVLKDMEHSGMGDFLIKLSHYQFTTHFFSLKRGIFFWEPIWILSFAGLILFVKNNRYIGVVCLILSLMIFFLLGSVNLVEMRNDAYGNRYHTSIIVFLAFGYASLINMRKQKPVLLFWSVISIIFVLMQYFFLVQYNITVPYNDPQISIKVFQNIPSILFYNPSLLIRSSSFFNILLNYGIKFESFIDYFMLIIIPVVLVLMLVAARYFFVFIIRQISQTEQILKFYYMTGLMIGLLIILSITLRIQNPPKTEEQIFDAYTMTAEMLIMSRAKDKQDEALELLREAKKIKSSDPKIYYLFGMSHYHKKEFQEALANLQKSLFIDQNYKNANFALGVISLEKGNLKEAIIRFRKVISLDDSYWSAYANLGIAYYNQGHHNDAISFWKKAIEINPALPDREKLERLMNIIE